MIGACVVVEFAVSFAGWTVGLMLVFVGIGLEGIRND